MAERTKFSADGVIAIAAHPGLVVQRIHGKGTRGALEEVAPLIRDAALTGPRYVHLVEISPTSARDIPGDGFRRTASEIFADEEGRSAALAFVVTASGFLGATTRAVIAGLSVVSRATRPQKVFGEPQEAAAWLHEQMPEGKSSKEILAALDDLIELADACATA